MVEGAGVVEVGSIVGEILVVDIPLVGVALVGPGDAIEGDPSLPDCGDRLVELVPLIWEPSGVHHVAGVDDELGIVLEVGLYYPIVEW